MTLALAADIASSVRHWQPDAPDQHKPGLGVPADAYLEMQDARLADIFCAPAQSVQRSASGEWWDSVMFGFHGKHRDDNPHYHRQMQAQLETDPSKLPALVLAETDAGLEIIDGWHRASIARHVGIERLPAYVYTRELQARWETGHRPQLGTLNNQPDNQHVSTDMDINH